MTFKILDFMVSCFFIPYATDVQKPYNKMFSVLYFFQIFTGPSI